MLNSLSTSIRCKHEPLRSLAFGGISGAYAQISTPYTHPARIYYLQNLTDVTLMFSWDGVTDGFPLVSEAFLLIDVTSNRTDFGGAFAVAQGDATWVKALGDSSPTIGSVYLSIFYGFNSQ